VEPQTGDTAPLKSKDQLGAGDVPRLRSRVILWDENPKSLQWNKRYDSTGFTMGGLA
jgi:hypothetical protein